MGEIVRDRYRIERLLGVGGTASVFEAWEIQTERRVAIKVLHEALRNHPTIPKRFVQEAKAARSLKSPHAVRIEAVGKLGRGLPFIVMEYLEGTDLSNLLRHEGGSLAVERTLYLVDQVAAALEEAHAAGIIHRDLKPENIFVIQSEIGELVKLVDFGISKIISSSEQTRITATGTTVGTPQYMAVEQLRGVKDLDGRVDIYAMGILIYELLAGVCPYDGTTNEEIMLKAATQPAPPISSHRPELPSAFIAVVSRAMAKDRRVRFQTVGDLRRALLPFWSGNRPDFNAVLPAAIPLAFAADELDRGSISDGAPSAGELAVVGESASRQLASKDRPSQVPRHETPVPSVVIKETETVREAGVDTSREDVTGPSAVIDSEVRARETSAQADDEATITKASRPRFEMEDETANRGRGSPVLTIAIIVLLVVGSLGAFVLARQHWF